ncbi:MAG: type IV secretion system protein VirB10 [Steroidobacteraceae bacterium]
MSAPPNLQDAVPDPNVHGERTTAIVHAARSMQSRVGSLLAAALMITLGVSALIWYYGHALTRTTRMREAAQTAATRRAQGEMPLPSLGDIEPPRASSAAVIDAAESGLKAHRADVPLAEARSESPAASPFDAALGNSAAPIEVHPMAPTPGQSALARRLSGTVLARSSESEPSTAQMQGPLAAAKGGMGDSSATGADPDAGARGARVRGDEGLQGLLRTAATPAVAAEVMSTQRFLLPQGSFIDCTLETAIDSTLPGMTTCITPSDTFGADGKVVLLERGTKLVGETRGQVQQGQARVFVLWTQARTPSGVIVPLASPGTDELGRAGLPGEVEHHFWQRFGAAMLITLIDGAVQAGVQASARSGGTVIYAPSASQDVLTEVLKDTVAIPPTVIKGNGDRIQVFVARDLDFRPVYELRLAASGP